MFNSYKQLFEILKTQGSFTVSTTFTPLTDEETRKIANLHHAGIVSIQIATFGYKVVRNRVRIGDSVVLTHPNGVAQLKHTVDGRKGEYTIIQHPTLNHKLYRKVSWNDTVNGWVAA